MASERLLLQQDNKNLNEIIKKLSEQLRGSQQMQSFPPRTGPPKKVNFLSQESYTVEEEVGRRNIDTKWSFKAFDQDYSPSNNKVHGRYSREKGVSGQERGLREVSANVSWVSQQNQSQYNHYKHRNNTS
mmetsp:Transcript_39006/g.37322  ORF Transcript_39006/g.37322 Transcript_39006/m.37322 type:complete len:130 (-) Transcript_39006:520-909(-)